MNQIAHLIREYATMHYEDYKVIATSFLLGLIVVLISYKIEKFQWLNSFCWTLLSIILCRIILVYLPFSPIIFYEVIKDDRTSGRLRSDVSLEAKVHYSGDAPEYFAIGNSQVAPIFNSKALREELQLDYISLSGLRMAELQLYIDDIFKINPSAVILYLSDRNLFQTIDLIPFKDEKWKFKKAFATVF